MMEFIQESPLKEPLIFDSHAHYEDSRFDQDRENLFETLKAHGVGGIITCGCDKESSLAALKMAKESDIVYAAVGIHPGNIDSGTTVSDIEKLLNFEKCVAIGEIGLDYYWVQDNKEKQKEIFISQLELAKKYNLPVLVHDRDAHADTLEILKEYKPKGVVHSFSGSMEMAEDIINLGMYIGVGGVITFKNAKKLPDIVKNLPEDKILLETDAPYLSPVPFRGKTNNSALIYLTAEKIAEIRNTTTEHILKITYQNAKTLFGIN